MHASGTFIFTFMDNGVTSAGGLIIVDGRTIYRGLSTITPAQPSLRSTSRQGVVVGGATVRHGLCPRPRTRWIASKSRSGADAA